MSQKLGEAYYFLLDKIYCLRLRGSFYYKKFNPEAKQKLFWKSNLREDLVLKPACLVACAQHLQQNQNPQKSLA